MVEALSCIGSNDSYRVLFRTDTDANALVHTAKNPSRHGEAEVFLRPDKAIMTLVNQPRPIILLLEDVEETRHLLEIMLEEDGYDAELARDEEDAILRARSRSPDLILMALDLEPEQLVTTAQRIRDQATLAQDVAVVIFCVSTIPQGAEREIHKNVYVTRPDNFDQLRDFLRWLLRKRFPTC